MRKKELLSGFYVCFILFQLATTYFIIIFYLSTSFIETLDITTHWVIGFMYSCYYLLPVALYLIRSGKQDRVKYFYFLVYSLIIIINDLLTYLGSSSDYESGNAIEIFFLLFSPIFVNRRYYWLVTIGTIVKYLIIGLILSTTNVLAPIVLVTVFAIVAYIFLNRFTGYVRAIENSFDKQLQGIVKGVIATLELKDPYTRGHSERVAYYALSMAKDMDKFSNEELKEFNYACLLHDVGKINIPDSILMKPSRLTNEEYEIIKSHPSVGAEAMLSVEGLNNGINVIRSHHERWDGKGYPDQLAGECIPLLARITSIADAFDAMTSSRSYREAMPLQEAYQIIIEGQGTQFDPNLVEMFKKIYPKWVDFHQSYPWVKK